MAAQGAVVALLGLQEPSNTGHRVQGSEVTAFFWGGVQGVGSRVQNSEFRV